MSTKTFTLAAAALFAVAGCSIPYAEQNDIRANFCSTDGDCAEGSVCRSVGGGERTCVASFFDLANVVLEVRPAIGEGAAIAPSLVDPEGWPPSDADSQLLSLPLDLPPYVDVSPGQILLPCAGDTPVPAKLTFRPVTQLAGLLQDQKYEAQSALDSPGVQLAIPQGTYDIYAVPKPDLAAMPDCAVAPPIFVPGWELTKGKGFAKKAAAPLVLKGQLKLSEKEDFTKWFLEVVEPIRGQTISQVVQPEQVGIALEVPFQVAFDWTVRSFTPVIRLRPPDGSGKPVIHWRLDAVALQGVVGNEVPVKLDVSGIDTQPRPVQGHVLDASGKAVAATVTLRSMSISKVELARYETVVETDDSGFFTSALPPGDYQVIARPHPSGYAIGLTAWEVTQGNKPFSGNAVQLPEATTLAGSVSTPWGEPADVEVRLTPAATSAVAYLATVIASEVQPRQTSTFTEYGQFQVAVDPGYFDLTVLSPRGAGYPWLVRPNLFITPSKVGAAAPVVSLEPFRLQDPVVVLGTVRDSQMAPLGGATIRAWIPLGDLEGKIATSAVQIGETVSDKDGSYVLLLPPSIK